MHIVKKLALVMVGSAFVAGGLAGCGEKTDAPAKAPEPVKEPERK